MRKEGQKEAVKVAGWQVSRRNRNKVSRIRALQQEIGSGGISSPAALT